MQEWDFTLRIYWCLLRSLKERIQLRLGSGPELGIGVSYWGWKVLLIPISLLLSSACQHHAVLSLQSIVTASWYMVENECYQTAPSVQLHFSKEQPAETAILFPIPNSLLRWPGEWKSCPMKMAGSTVTIYFKSGEGTRKSKLSSRYHKCFLQFQTKNITMLKWNRNSFHGHCWAYERSVLVSISFK